MSHKVIVGGLILFFTVTLGLSAFFMFGCGQQSSTSTTNYSMTGTTAGVTGVSAKALAVTHVVAIGSNSEKYLGEYDASTGRFTIAMMKGYPYAVGFYNKSSGAITLLGYVKQNDVDWNSIPVINPSGNTLDMGSISIDTTSQEATMSVDLSTIIANMNMDLTTANFYGDLNGPMACLTNVDVDGNGEFDFQEGKNYLFSSYINMGVKTGQLSQMLNGNYNESYDPTPQSYTQTISCQGDAQTVGTALTFTFPAVVSSSKSAPNSSVSSAVEDAGSGCWTAYSKISGDPIVSPEATPAGTYTVTVGSKAYTFSNYKSSDLYKVGSNNGIIYPVLSLVRDANDYITTVNFKWKKWVNGVATTPTAAEIQAAVEDTSSDTAFVHTSPFVSFFTAEQTLKGGIVKFSRDGSSVDVSSVGIKYSELNHIQVAYNLNSRVICKFDLF